MRELRRHTRRAILAALWASPPVLAWLAWRGGFAWELVTLLGAGVALATTMAGRPGQARAGVALAAGLALSCLLALGAGHGVLPPWLAAALPFLALVLAAGLCSGRALAVAGAILAAHGLLPLASGATAMPGQAAALLLAAATMGAAQGAARQALRHRATVLPPPAPRGAPVWTVPQGGGGFSGLMVQAERGADGSLRLAVAGAAPRMRVTVS